MPREPPVISATRPWSENRSLNMRTSIALPKVLGGAGVRVKEAAALPSPLVGEGGAKRRMRGSFNVRESRRESLIRLRFAPAPSPTRGEGKKLRRVDTPKPVPHRGGGAGGQHREDAGVLEIA